MPIYKAQSDSAQTNDVLQPRKGRLRPIRSFDYYAVVRQNRIMVQLVRLQASGAAGNSRDNGDPQAPEGALSRKALKMSEAQNIICDEVCLCESNGIS
jgi:hypothetical protein